MSQAKNLFVICAAYWSTYLPVMVRQALKSQIPDAVQFAISWIYISSAAVNGCLYIALHSSVRRELRRYLPRCRNRTAVTVAATRVVGDGGGDRYALDRVDDGAGLPVAPATAMTSRNQRESEDLPAVV